MVAALQKRGVPMEGVTLADASGLHRANRATCRSLLATCSRSVRSPRSRRCGAGLSVVGQKGTLVNQLLGLGVEGKLSAKTGFLAGVTGFVGRIDGDQQLQFAYVDNGADYSQGGVGGDPARRRRDPAHVPRRPRRRRARARPA